MLSSDNTDNSYDDGILPYANQGSTKGSQHPGLGNYIRFLVFISSTLFFISPKDFYIILLSNPSNLMVPNENYSLNLLFAIHYISIHCATWSIFSKYGTFVLYVLTLHGSHLCL